MGELFAWSYDFVLLWECFACLVAEKMEGKVENFLKIESFDFGVSFSNFSLSLFGCRENVWGKGEILLWLRIQMIKVLSLNHIFGGFHWFFFFWLLPKQKIEALILVCSSLCCFLHVHNMLLNLVWFNSYSKFAYLFSFKRFFLIVFCLFVCLLGCLGKRKDAKFFDFAFYLTHLSALFFWRTF